MPTRLTWMQYNARFDLFLMWISIHWCAYLKRNRREKSFSKIDYYQIGCEEVFLNWTKLMLLYFRQHFWIVFIVCVSFTFLLFDLYVQRCYSGGIWPSHHFKSIRIIRIFTPSWSFITLISIPTHISFLYVSL